MIETLYFLVILLLFFSFLFKYLEIVGFIMTKVIEDNLTFFVFYYLCFIQWIQSLAMLLVLLNCSIIYINYILIKALEFYLCICIHNERYFRMFSCEGLYSILLLSKDMLRGIWPKAKRHFYSVLNNMT